MVNEALIVQLLRKISADHDYLTWKLRCAYSDGLGEPVYEIALTDRRHARTKKSITFRMGSGQVLNCGYKEFTLETSANIVDLLLDVINYENAHAH